MRDAVAKEDLVATSTFHAGLARSVAGALGKPVVTLTTHPDLRAAILRRLEEEDLTVVVVDPPFGERVRMLYSEATGKADRIRIVLADDSDAVGNLYPEDPVLLTRAAHERLGDLSLELLFPHAPTISPESDRELAELLIRFNRKAAYSRS